MNFNSSLKYSQNKNQSVELIQYQYLSLTIETTQMRGTDITGKEAVSIHANLHDTYPQ